MRFAFFMPMVAYTTFNLSCVQGFVSTTHCRLSVPFTNCIDRLGSKLGISSNEQTGSESDSFEPTWKDILEVPISIEKKEDFDGLPRSKRIAIVSRSFVLHLTLLSGLGPLIIRGCIKSATGNESMVLNPKLSLLWTINIVAWHAFHNFVNDWQDLEDDDKAVNSFRSDYGCHALKQGFLSKPQYLRLMGIVAIPGVLLTNALRGTPVGPAGPWGMSSLFLYTILFKPLALGEFLIYLTWGPLMAGFGAVAAGAPFFQVSTLFTDLATVQYGLAALGVIMGKHTDKINRSKKRTLPKLLGYPYALVATGAVLVAPHAVLLGTFVKERLLSHGSSTPSIPLGASLAFLTLFRELPGSLRVLRKGQIMNGKPNLPPGTTMKGWAANFQVDRTWPLWFAAVCGWHAITFLYFFVIGSGLEWGGRTMYHRIFI